MWQHERMMIEYRIKAGKFLGYQAVREWSIKLIDDRLTLSYHKCLPYHTALFTLSNKRISSLIGKTLNKSNSCSADYE
jgi:hypothetical protein